MIERGFYSHFIQKQAGKIEPFHNISFMALNNELAFHFSVDL